MLTGRTEKLPYSLSRWTDLPAAKWPWFEQQLNQGWMVGINPRSAMPGQWSLVPEDVLGLIFWTRNSTNLIRNADRLKKCPLVIHFTLTGWSEVEKGAPNLADGLAILKDTVGAFGAKNVTWRFSPIPDVTDVLDRFESIASAVAKLGLTEVYLSFLQENDLLPEARPTRIRTAILRQLAIRSHGLQVLLCNEDKTLDLGPEGLNLGPAGFNLSRGVCESGFRFDKTTTQIEACGCALAVDPFTINESCTMGCAYCYAADATLAPKKRNTTKGLLPLL